MVIRNDVTSLEVDLDKLQTCLDWCCQVHRRTMLDNASQDSSQVFHKSACTALSSSVVHNTSPIKFAV